MPLLSFVGSGSRFVPEVVPSVRMRGQNTIVMTSQARSMFMPNQNRAIIMPSRPKKTKL